MGSFRKAWIAAGSACALLGIATGAAPRSALRAGMSEPLGRDDLWSSMAPSGTFLGGTEAAGQAPEPSTAGLVWDPLGADPLELVFGPGQIVDALGLTHWEITSFHAAANFAVDAANFQDDLNLQFSRPVPGDLSRARWEGLDGSLQLVIEATVLPPNGSCARVLFRYTVTNFGLLSLDNIWLVRSLDPAIQIGTASPDRSQAMSLPETGIAMATDPASGATVLLAAIDGGFGSTFQEGVASIEPGIVLEPSDVFFSPRDPQGAIEDTALHVAFDFGTLDTGENNSGSMLLVVAPDPATALGCVELASVPALPEGGAAILALCLVGAASLFLRRLSGRPRSAG